MLKDISFCVIPAVVLLFGACGGPAKQEKKKPEVTQVVFAEELDKASGMLIEDVLKDESVVELVQAETEQEEIKDFVACEDENVEQNIDDVLGLKA